MISRRATRITGRSDRRTGGTVLIMVAVIAIVAAVIGVYFARQSLLSKREESRGAMALNNLSMQVKGMIFYSLRHDNHFPSAAICSAEGKPLLSWRVALLPYLEQQALYEKFRLDEPWDSPNNLPLLKEMPTCYLAPGIADPARGETAFVMCVGPEAVYTSHCAAGPTNFDFPYGGTVNGVRKLHPFLYEVDAEHAVPWTKPADLEIAPGKDIVGVGNSRARGLHVALHDGSARAISREELTKMGRAMFTKQGADYVEQQP